MALFQEAMLRAAAGQHFLLAQAFLQVCYWIRTIRHTEKSTTFSAGFGPNFQL